MKIVFSRKKRRWLHLNPYLARGEKACGAAVPDRETLAKRESG